VSRPKTPKAALKYKTKTPKAALRYKIFLTIFASLLVMQLLAQDSTSAYRPVQNNSKRHTNSRMRTDEEGDIIFNKQNIFGIHLSSNGYGLSFEKGYFKTPSRTVLYQFELNEVHSPKEHHITATTDNGYSYSSVVPYKANNLYEVRAAIGQEILIGGKGNKNGVAVQALYSGGLTLGLLKPYLLDVTNPINGESTQMTYAQLAASENNPSQFGFEPTGAAGFTAGWDKVAFKPAINARQAMRFDYGRENKTVAAVEVGITEEYYLSDIDLMYLVKGQHFFFNSYVAILFGNRK
jgi:hypothetical protein